MSTTFRSPTPGIASGLVLFWVQVYTAGLSSESREHRIGQIISDLWEHYSDRTEEGASPALISIEALGRAARGVAADLFWRFQLEGPKVQLNIPIERIGGAFLLLLVAAVMLTLNVPGYDTSVEGFDGELRRLADIESWQVGVYTGFQILSGIGMMAGAVVLCLALRRYSATPAILAAVALAAAGLIALVNAALYTTAAGLADEYVAAAPDHRDAVLTVGRAFMVMLATSILVMAVMLALGVYGFALITARHHLVPGWLSFVSGGSFFSMGAAIVTDLVEKGEIAWLFFIAFLGLLLLWLLVAGAWLLLGGSTRASDNRSQSAPVDVVMVPEQSPEPSRVQQSALSRWLFGVTIPLFCGSLLIGGVIGGLVGIPGVLIVTLPAGVLLIAAVAYSRSRLNPAPDAQA